MDSQSESDRLLPSRELSQTVAQGHSLLRVDAENYQAKTVRRKGSAHARELLARLDSWWRR
jgi:hypothetical protein